MKYTYAASKVLMLVVLSFLIIILINTLFHTKIITINCDYNSPLHNTLVDIINNKSRHLNSDIKFLSIFNDTPPANALEALNILSSRFSNRIDFVSFIYKRHRSARLLQNEHVLGKKIIGRSERRTLTSSYFLLLYGWRIHYVDSIFDPKIIGDLLIKATEPHRRPSYLAKNELIEKVLAALQKKDNYLWDVNNKRRISLKSLPMAPTILLFHSGCSSCLLENTLLDNFPTKQNILLLFPFLTLPSEIEGAINKLGAIANIYIDQDDVLGIGFADIHVRENPLIIVT